MKEPRAVLTSSTGRIDTSLIPDYVAEGLAQTALAAIRRDWENPEFRAEYNRWKAERDTHTPSATPPAAPDGRNLDT